MPRCCGVARTSSRDDPVLIGEANGNLYRVRTLVGQFGFRFGAEFWATGDGVPVRLAPGVRTLVLVS